MPTATGARTISDIPTSNQWTVATEPKQKQFPDSSSLVTTAKSWATENMFSLFKLCSDKDYVVLACSPGNEYRQNRLYILVKCLKTIKWKLESKPDKSHT